MANLSGREADQAQVVPGPKAGAVPAAATSKAQHSQRPRAQVQRTAVWRAAIHRADRFPEKAAGLCPRCGAGKELGEARRSGALLVPELQDTPQPVLGCVPAAALAAVQAHPATDQEMAVALAREALGRAQVLVVVRVPGLDQGTAPVLAIRVL